MSGPTGLSGLPKAPDHVEPAPEWGRLDARMLVVRPLHEIVGFVPVLVALLVFGTGDAWRVLLSLAVIVLLVLRGLFSWLTTRYRISESQVELHSGLLSRKRKAVPRDRIRTADLTAKFGHRLFGLSAIRIGTGQHAKGKADGLLLDAVPVPEAERLRVVLLQRGVGHREAAVETAPAEARSTAIATLHRSWLRFAPLSLSGLLSIGAVIGVLVNAANEVDVRISRMAAVKEVVRWARESSLVLVVAVAIAVVLVLAVLGSLLKYVLQYAGYRLTRQADGTVRVTRGLLTTRSVSIEEKRLRGVQVGEPMLLRAGHGAKVSAVTTGLGKEQGGSLLLPPAPRAEAHRVVAEVLRLPEPPTSAELTRHPRRALARRLVRAVGAAVLVEAALLLTVAAWDWPLVLPLAWLVALPAAAWLGVDRYRRLGHALTERYLVSRTGSLDTKTVALQRDGIIGWRIRRTWFQRRTGLMTVTATTAAGRGAYSVPDIGEADGVALALDAVPGLLRPFAEPVSPESRPTPS
ncbi:PH domain-containing protein [Labedaea rhizosphaerae]|uniref:Putative membrane protein n=1 Tax=Labedaea rhizosphaerae TaxID=598644 RepID=A0A4R6S114_LABRH|nr:PH domain-containing protein [Labedaea rhizosphaerae]TDP92894.1 putative membrane protein [Labedaea rhizosphaerae]